MIDFLSIAFWPDSFDQLIIARLRGNCSLGMDQPIFAYQGTISIRDAGLEVVSATEVTEGGRRYQPRALGCEGMMPTKCARRRLDSGPGPSDR
jgi:hypothetical protein